MKAGLYRDDLGQFGLGTPDGVIGTPSILKYILQEDYPLWYKDYYVYEHTDFFYTKAKKLLIPHELM